MNTLKFCLSLVFVGIVFASCSSSPEPVQTTGIPTDTLLFTDTIGVFFGDTNYVFGDIAMVIPVPEGYALLDRAYCKLAFYNKNGEFLRYTGGRGEAPGEYSRPYWACRLKNGEFFIYDFGSQKTTLLNSSLEFVTSNHTNYGLPVKFAAAGDSTIVVQQITFNFVEDDLVAGYKIYSMNPWTGEEITVYREHTEQFEGAGLDLKPFYSFFTTDSRGNVILGEYDSDQYALDILSAEGDSLNRIVFEEEERVEFDIEIHQLIYLPITMPLTTESGTGTLEVSAPDFHPYITYLSTDENDNIWIRRMGLPTTEYWDVVSQEGELLKKVVLYADSNESHAYPALNISPHGIVATMNENEEERFYIIE